MNYFGIKVVHDDWTHRTHVDEKTGKREHYWIMWVDDHSAIYLLADDDPDDYRIANPVLYIEYLPTAAATIAHRSCDETPAQHFSCNTWVISAEYFHKLTAMGKDALSAHLRTHIDFVSGLPDVRSYAARCTPRCDEPPALPPLSSGAKMRVRLRSQRRTEDDANSIFLPVGVCGTVVALTVDKHGDQCIDVCWDYAFIQARGVPGGDPGRVVRGHTSSMSVGYIEFVAVIEEGAE